MFPSLRSLPFSECGRFGITNQTHPKWLFKKAHPLFFSNVNLILRERAPVNHCVYGNEYSSPDNLARNQNFAGRRCTIDLLAILRKGVDPAMFLHIFMRKV